MKKFIFAVLMAVCLLGVAGHANDPNTHQSKFSDTGPLAPIMDAVTVYQVVPVEGLTQTLDYPVTAIMPVKISLPQKAWRVNRSLFINPGRIRCTVKALTNSRNSANHILDHVDPGWPA